MKLSEADLYPVQERNKELWLSPFRINGMEQTKKRIASFDEDHLPKISFSCEQHILGFRFQNTQKNHDRSREKNSVQSKPN